MLIGFAGGGTRNIFANKPVRNMAEMKGLKVRVQGAPIWRKTFTAAGMSPTVIAYDEVYNAIQNGVIQAGENEAAGVETMKFYEVGPNLNMTQHAITIRPICFSGKTFKKLPPDLQAAVIKAGKEAGIYGRQIESSEDTAKLEAMEKAGKLKRIAFADRAAMKKAVDPVMAEYAKEIGADAIYNKINSMYGATATRRGLELPPVSLSRRRGRHAQVDRWLLPAARLAAGRYGRCSHRAGDDTDHRALYRADSALDLDRGNGAVPFHLDGHAGRNGRHPRRFAFRSRRVARAEAAR
jgi:hypothetical protein